MGAGPGHRASIDLDLRRLRYFVAVAEGLHFGRAAERLYIAQPVLSRQVRKLEQDLGVQLFVRSSRHVELTDAGRQLLEEAQSLLAAVEGAVQRVRHSAQGLLPLRVGFYIGDPVRPVVKAFHAQQPGATVELARIYWSDQPAALHDGRVDVAFVHLPVEDDELAFVRLYTSPRIVLMPASHPLAERPQVSLQDLADDAVVRHRGASEAWEAWHNVDPRPDGRRPRSGPVVGNLEEKVEAVAAGDAVGFVPASAAAAIQLPGDVVAVEVTDLAPTQVCLAWRAGRESSAVTAFVAAARSVFDDAVAALAERPV